MTHPLLLVDGNHAVSQALKPSLQAAGWDVVSTDAWVHTDSVEQMQKRGEQPRLDRSLGDARYRIWPHDAPAMAAVIRELRPGAVVYCPPVPADDPPADAAHPRWFSEVPDAVAGILDALRLHCPDAPFVYVSTSRVYGEAPNDIALVEDANRFAYQFPAQGEGIDETMPTDRCAHSAFGAASATADALVLERGRTFGQPCCSIRLGCLAAAGGSKNYPPAIGFLSAILRCSLRELSEERVYPIFGGKGKQVRDLLHPCDLARFIDLFLRSPRNGEAYNLGGGRENSVSILDALTIAEDLSHQSMSWRILPRRVGDALCYISDTRKARLHFPVWRVTRSVPQIAAEVFAHAKGTKVETMVRWHEPDRPSPYEGREPVEIPKWAERMGKGG